MKIFFDTEFTGLHKNTTLISIGLVTESGETFYAELTDYDKTQVNDWIKENVVDNLLYNHVGIGMHCDNITNNIRIKGNTDWVRAYLKKWLEQFGEVEFISDVCHYDMVLLIDLVYGDALKMPYGKINSSCHDINQDIADYFDLNEIQAFDFSREMFLKIHNIEIEGEKHNSLYDAKVIKAIYEEIKSI